MDLKLRGKRALVTGSTAGIGQRHSDRSREARRGKGGGGPN